MARKSKKDEEKDARYSHPSEDAKLMEQPEPEEKPEEDNEEGDG